MERAKSCRNEYYAKPEKANVLKDDNYYESIIDSICMYDDCDNFSACERGDCVKAPVPLGDFAASNIVYSSDWPTQPQIDCLSVTAGNDTTVSYPHARCPLGFITNGLSDFQFIGPDREPVTIDMPEECMRVVAIIRVRGAKLQGGANTN